MIYRIRIAALLSGLALWLGGMAPLRALNPARGAGDYTMQGWFTEDGLPSNKIRDLVQARDGYLWLATAQGVARFDGHEFTTFTAEEHPTLGAREFLAAIEAPDGTLWFGSNEGLVRWREGRFERFTTADGLAHDYVRAFGRLRDGTIVACTRKGYSFLRDGRITTPGGVWKEISGVCRAFLECADGSMLLGTSAGLWRIKGERIEKLSGPGKLEGTSFFSLEEMPDGSVWIGYSAGVHCLRPDGTSQSYGSGEGLVGANVSDIKLDRDGSIWIAASGNLYRMTGGRIELANYEEKLKGTPLHRIHEDSEGALWIATVSGLFRLKNSVASLVGSNSGMEQTSVYTVLEARDKTWWLGVWYGGIYHYDGRRAERVPALAPLDRQRVFSLAEEPDGSLWIGAESGVYKYAGGVLTRYFHPEEEMARKRLHAAQPEALLPGLAHNWIYGLALDASGGLWVASDGGLYQAVDGKFRLHSPASGMPGEEFENVLCARNGDVWASSSEFGFVRRHEGKWIVYRFGEGPPQQRPLGMFEDTTGAIWVLSDGGGLARFKDETWRIFTTRDGLLDDVVSGMSEDDTGHFWISYARGMMRIPREQFDEVVAGTRTAVEPRMFNHADGLPRGETNPSGNPNAWRTADGRLLFGTDVGVAVIEPRSVEINEVEPPVYIERLSIDGVNADLSRPVIVPPGQARLHFHYSAVSLIAAEKVRFKIRLAPLDQGWVDVESERDMHYGGLPPGDYTFHVKASNNDGFWNEEGAKLAFTIRPHLYQTWWFYTLAAGLVAVSGWGYVSQRSRIAAKRMRVLSRLVEERTQELRGAKERAEAAVLAKNESIVALKRAQDEVSAERARFKFIFEAVPVGISLVEPNSDMRIVNPAHERITGIPAAKMNEPGAFERVTHPEDYARQRPLTRRYKAGEIDRFTLEKRYVRSDGSIVWATLTRRMFTDPATGVRQSITTVIDITERKEAEAKLAQTHRKLLEASRHAGMAEVATGVLHNVGNVLNSVNVSATLVGDLVRESKIASVTKLGALFQQHASDLGAFLGSDPRGRMIPGYLLTLSDELKREQATMLGELEGLRKNIEHIKDIVAMQQTYAKVSGVVESVPVIELVEDALRFNASALVRHGVDVVRDYADRPVATTERHKVMQVLVNLIRNAKYACDDSGRTDKVLTLRVETRDGRVRIAVIDNGVGIPAENLTRIFAHGFTTRKSGHGFGLHSGALAAKELGGSLFAQSEGLGKGATFVLELPLQREEPGT